MAASVTLLGLLAVPSCSALLDQTRVIWPSAPLPPAMTSTGMTFQTILHLMSHLSSYQINKNYSKILPTLAIVSLYAIINYNNPRVDCLDRAKYGTVDLSSKVCPMVEAG